MSLGHFKMIIVGMKEVKRTMTYTGDEDALIWRVHIVRRHLKNRLVISSELSAYILVVSSQMLWPVHLH
ncbi:hypothetical protein RDI58_024568 [Solanum bulbocastanum]|uniref:Uncharacterized protein n=1 Tax=Solanum bulbocastanum TaxID=147425 RepID=A0AAN8Y333_SOLBU